MKKLPLTKGLFSLVDDDVFEWAKNYQWRAGKREKNLYAIREKWTSLHQAIMGCSLNHQEIDHINGNGLDNRRENLRMVSHRANQMNRREHRNGHLVGTTYRKSRGNWQSYLRKNGKFIHLGSFKTQQETHEVYLRAVKNLGITPI